MSLCVFSLSWIFSYSRERKDDGKAHKIIVTSFKLLFYRIRKRIRNDFSCLMWLFTAFANAPFKVRSPTWRINKFEIEPLLSFIIHLIEKQIVLNCAVIIDFRKSVLHISVLPLHRYFANVDRIIHFAWDKLKDIILHQIKINEV